MRTALVTGAAGGIGAAIAGRLVRDVDVIATDRDTGLACDLTGDLVASKGALIGRTRPLAVELGGDGITVNAIAPGLTRTEAALRDVPAELFAQVRSRQAIDRALEPGDCAGAVAFLASGDAATMTGQTLTPDAGLVLL